MSIPRLTRPSCTSGALLGLLSLSLALASARVASAQTQVAMTTAHKTGPLGMQSNPACIDTISTSRLRPRLVFQRTDLARSDSAFTPQVALIAEALASRVRASLGDSDSVTRADTLADWRHLEGWVPVHIVLYRAHPAAWHVDSGVAAGKGKLTALYARALRQLDPNVLTVVWPSSVTSDSAVLHFRLDALDGGDTTRVALRRVPVFVMLGVARVHASVKHGAHSEYPRDQEIDGYDGNVLMQAVIDIEGHLDPATLHDVEPADLVAEGRFDWRYHQFEEVAKNAMLRTTFNPARIGGCPVKEEVEMPFTFMHASR